ncbi:hypothetical protein K1719_045505 [Acacia pycnantha]|nr:hypothetical protein K1719_045505 [Acacia pycnantha]
MEETMKWGQLSLISELIQGKEFAEQLCFHLSSSSSLEEKEHLLEKILSSYEKALSLLNVGETDVTNGKMMMDSLCSFIGGSPKSEVLDQDFNHKDSIKKRKTMPRWTKQVKDCSGTGLEGSQDDGYSWRKYGQKDILGSKFPRGYYRCTHRNVQGCLATKQVQRSDEDPTILEITYRGRHTCTQASHVKKTLPLKRKVIENNPMQKHQDDDQPLLELNPEGFLNVGAEVEVKTEEFDTKEKIFQPFCFPYASIGSEDEDNLLFSEPLIENHFMGSLSSPKFISPATPESNIFCLNVQTSESDVTDTVISAPTSVTNSPIADLDLLIDFDSCFPLNEPELFSS